MPEPLSPKIGFGMKVAVLLLRQATFFTYGGRVRVGVFAGEWCCVEERVGVGP
jgi:hypothetical protein